MRDKISTLILYMLPVIGGILISHASAIPQTGYTLAIAGVGLICLAVSAPVIYRDMYVGDIELTPAESEWIDRHLKHWRQNAKGNHLS